MGFYYTGVLAPTPAELVHLENSLLHYRDIPSFFFFRICLIKYHFAFTIGDGYLEFLKLSPKVNLITRNRKISKR